MDILNLPDFCAMSHFTVHMYARKCFQTVKNGTMVSKKIESTIVFSNRYHLPCKISFIAAIKSPFWIINSCLLRYLWLQSQLELNLVTLLIHTWA